MTPKVAIYGILIALSLVAQQIGTSNQLAEKPHNMTRAVGCVLSSEDGSNIPPMFLRPNPLVDERYTTVPLSVWKRMIEDAINNHLLIQGMTKTEAAAAFVLGDYDFTACSIVRYEEDFLTTHCLKYSGDDCIEYEHLKAHLDLSFTKAGYLLGIDTIGNPYLSRDRLNAHMDSRKKILDGGESVLREFMEPSVKNSLLPPKTTSTNTKRLDLQQFCVKYPSIFGVGPINDIGQKGPRCW
jgi:hypothetical protein